MHALLLHLHGQQGAARREAQVSKVMQAIGGTNMGSPSRLHIVFFRSVYAAAAIVFIAAGIFFFVSSQTPAMASLNDILGALAKPGDRAFAVQVEPPDTEDPSRHGLHNATLDTRDGKCYLLMRKGGRGGEIVNGYDGRQSWRVRNGEIVETREGLGAGGMGVPESMSGALFVDLPQILQVVQNSYNVEVLNSAPLPGTGKSLRRVLLRRKSREVRGAETIEIFADLKQLSV